MFVDVKKAHLNARRDEVEWVELADELEEHGWYAKLRKWLYCMRKAASECEDDYSRKLTMDRFRRGREASTIFLPSRNASESCGGRRRSHVRPSRVGVKEDQIKILRVVRCQDSRNSQKRKRRRPGS